MAQRFEYSIDCLIKRKERLTEAYHTLLNQPRPNDADYEVMQSKANRINRQIMDIDDAINNLYTIREVCPSR